ncbi:MAG: hypothetical protein ACI8UO_003300 [Verrucomicrobiales bacterium]|jgi:hypothetical protein
MSKLRFSLIITILAGLGLSTASAEPFSVGGFVFKPGEKWTAQAPTSSMRKAELKFDGSGDESPVAVFFEFGKSGVEANITRWKGQFQGGPTDEKIEKLADNATIVELSGVYLDGPPFGGNKTPKDGYKMLGAILEGETTAVFIKMTAPAEAADEAKEAFIALVKAALEK